MTLRWPCRRGDFFLWLGYPNIFSGPEAIQCYDFWEMRDGQHVTITNRLEDLPLWFRLHPTEVCDSFVHAIMARSKKAITPVSPWRVRTSGG